MPASDGDSKQARTTVPTLTDGVVRLDSFTLENVADHLAGEDEETARRFGWWPKRSTPETVANAIHRWNDAWATSGPTRAFAVRNAFTGHLVGHCELRHKEAGIAHVSYSTGWANRGRGYASRALRLLSAWAFREGAAAFRSTVSDFDQLRAVTRAAQLQAAIRVPMISIPYAPI